MGCKASKHNQALPPIDSTFLPTTRSDLDDFFQRASKVLQKVETIRYRIDTNKQKGSQLAGTAQALESPYTKAVQVLFWALSAAKEGQISKTGLIISDEPPFLSLNLDGLCKETAELFKTLQDYLEILEASPESLQELVVQLQNIKTEQTQIKKGLDPKTPAKTMKIIDENMKKLSECVAISAKVLSHVPDEQKNANDLIKYMQLIITNSDEVGAKVFAAKLIKPIEIFKWVELENKKRGKSRGPSVDKKKKDKENQNADKTKDNKNKKDDKKDKNKKKGANEKSAQDQEIKDHKDHKENIVSPTDVIIGGDNAKVTSEKNNEGLKRDEHQGHNGAYGDGFGTSLSFGGHYSAEKHTQDQQSKINMVESKQKFEVNTSQQTLINNQSIDGPTNLNDSNNLTGNNKKSNQQEKLTKKQTTDKFSKGQIFVREKELEIVIREKNEEPQKVKSPGYLSPGGTKQAGILQGEENILDGDDEGRGYAHESFLIKHFLEKAQNYLDMKD